MPAEDQEIKSQKPSETVSATRSPESVPLADSNIEKKELPERELDFEKINLLHELHHSEDEQPPEIELPKKSFGFSSEQEEQRRRKIALRLSGLWIAIFIAAVIAMVAFGPLITAIVATVIAGAAFIVFLAFEIRDWWRGRKRSSVSRKETPEKNIQDKKPSVSGKAFKPEPTLEVGKTLEQEQYTVLEWSRGKNSIYIDGGLISDGHPSDFTASELQSLWKERLFSGFNNDEIDKMTKFFLMNMNSKSIMFLMKSVLYLVVQGKDATPKDIGYPDKISISSKDKQIFVEDTGGFTEVYLTSNPVDMENAPFISGDQDNPVVAARLSFVISFSQSGVPICSLKEVHLDPLREDQIERLTEKLAKAYEESLISEHIMGAAPAKKLAATYKQELKREYQKNLSEVKRIFQPEEITKKVQEMLDEANHKFIEAQNAPASSPSLLPLP